MKFSSELTAAEDILSFKQQDYQKGPLSASGVTATVQNAPKEQAINLTIHCSQKPKNAHFQL